MAIIVRMPLLSQTMTEGTITKWLRQEGDTLRKGDPLLEVETDKALVEAPAPEDGVLLKILVGADQLAQVGAGVAILGARGEDISSLLGAATAAAPAESRTETGAPLAKKGPAPTAKAISPRARRLAEEHHIDWQRIRGSGSQGQITEKDIQLRIAEAKRVDTLQPLSRLRRIIAERLATSQQERAHIYLTVTLDMTEAVSWRNRLSSDMARQGGGEITYNDLFVKALGICLSEFPWMNSTLSGEGVWLHSSVNIGVAVAVEDDEGLVVPVIRDVQGRALEQIAEARAALVKRAKEKRLLPDDMAGGTFTLSNLGMYGVEQFTAIINPPETGILAVGSITEEPRAIEGNIAIRSVMRVTLGADHRVVDGALAAQFLKRFKALLEQPLQLTACKA